MVLISYQQTTVSIFYLVFFPCDLQELGLYFVTGYVSFK